MQVFEFHFRPKEKKEDFIFDSFCFEPDKAYEKRLGGLFLVGGLTNALPQHAKFLDNFAAFFKKQYYSSSMKFSPENALKHGLKSANAFLEGIAKEGDVSWLGNLNLAILSVKNHELNFAKVGFVKILLLRHGQLTDVGKNLEFSEIEPYPLKIFGNIVSGELLERDVILVLTREVFNFFTGRGLLKKIVKFLPFDDRKLTSLLKTREKELLKISGVCLALVMTKTGEPGAEKSGAFTFGERTEKFSLKSVFSPFVHSYKRVKSYFSGDFLRFRGLAKKFQKLKKKADSAKNAVLKSSKIKIRKVKFTLPFTKIKIKLPQNLNKNVILVSSLIIFLLLGFFIFKVQEQGQLKRDQATLVSVRDSVSKAESYLALGDDQNAFAVYEKAWQAVFPVSEKKGGLQNEALSLRNDIESGLEKTSQLEKIQDPKLLFEFDEKEFIPQKIVYFNGNLYLFSPVAQNVYKVSLSGQKSMLAANEVFSDAAALSSQILFFQKPNAVFFLKNDSFGQPLFLTLPSSDFEVKALSVYLGGLYLLDNKKGEIIKYANPISGNKNSPQLWMPQTEDLVDAKSMAVDGPIWILNKDNSISQYYLGKFRETIIPDFFPWPENLSTMNTLYDLIYVLEPGQKRLIILSKTNKVMKQFQSDKFDNLKDFAVSENGRTVWLLNGTEIYQVKW